MLLGIRWGSLRTKIIAWSFVPTMIILVAVAVVIFYAYQEVTVKGYTDQVKIVSVRRTHLCGDDVWR